MTRPRVGCSDSGGSLSADGPLSSGNGIHDRIPTGSICAPGGRAQTFGDQQYTNYGNQPVVLNRVVLLRTKAWAEAAILRFCTAIRFAMRSVDLTNLCCFIVTFTTWAGSRTKQRLLTFS